VAVEFQHDMDGFVVWRDPRQRPELNRITCGHAEADCPYGQLDILLGGTTLPRIGRRILSPRVLEAVARDHLERVAAPRGAPPAVVQLSEFFDQEAVR
jgi:hypothetical protein